MTLKKNLLGSGNMEESSSSSFHVEKIKESLTSVLDFEDFKKITPRDLYHEPFDTLLTSEQKLFLMDMGIVNCRSATKEEYKEPNINQNKSAFPGMSGKLDYRAIHRYVPQNGAKKEQDIPLFSEGFSQCHAVIIYNPNTCTAMMLHVVHRNFEQEHMYYIENFLDGQKGEAIFVYGSESRCSYESDHKYLEKLGCVSRNIFVSTGPFHRGILYDQTKNKIFVDRKNPPYRDFLTFGGFSNDFYDIKKRETYDLENRKRILELEAMITVANFTEYADLKGYYSQQDFETLLDKMEIVLGKKIDKNVFMEYCVQNNEVMFDGETIIVPEGFRYNEGESIYERYGYTYKQHDYTINFISSYITDRYYKKALIYLTKNGYTLLEANRSESLFVDDSGKKFILANQLDNINLYFVDAWEDEQKIKVTQVLTILLDQLPNIKEAYRKSVSGFQNDKTVYRENKNMPYYKNRLGRFK